MKEKRNKTILVKCTQEEIDLIYKAMKKAKLQNRSDYIRKMATNGKIIVLDIPEISEISRLFSIVSNNINQLARFANRTGNLYQQDVLDVSKKLDEIKLKFGEALARMSKVGV